MHVYICCACHRTQVNNILEVSGLGNKAAHRHSHAIRSSRGLLLCLLHVGLSAAASVMWCCSSSLTSACDRLVVSRWIRRLMMYYQSCHQACHGLGLNYFKKKKLQYQFFQTFGCATLQLLFVLWTSHFNLNISVFVRV